MGKRLAIKGHPTRGNEVIELLEMIGGKNIHNLFGDNRYGYYVIEGCQNEIRADEYIFGNENMHFFTLKEFLEKYPFKVGDFVRIPEYESEVCILKMKWCPLSEHIEYLVCPNDEEEWFTADELLEDNDDPNKTRDCKKCGLHFGSIRCFDKDCPHNTPKPKSYAIGLKNGKVIDCIANKETNMNKREAINMTNETITPTPDITDDVTDKNNCDIECPDGYEFYDANGNLIGTKVMMRPKKPKYPTTYGECCTELINHDKYREIKVAIAGISYKADLIISFTKLLICRDAYWKIAGEEMGLGKPWEPDWDEETNKFTISNKCNKIYLNNTAWYAEVLSFPTVEMRDIFYENFKDLIEQCKELL